MRLPLLRSMCASSRSKRVITFVLSTAWSSLAMIKHISFGRRITSESAPRSCEADARYPGHSLSVSLSPLIPLSCSPRSGDQWRGHVLCTFVCLFLTFDNFLLEAQSIAILLLGRYLHFQTEQINFYLAELILWDLDFLLSNLQSTSMVLFDSRVWV